MGKVSNLGADLQMGTLSPCSPFSIPSALPFTHQAAAAMGILGPCNAGSPGVAWCRQQWEAGMCGEVNTEIGGWQADILGKGLGGEGPRDLAGVYFQYISSLTGTG